MSRQVSPGAHYGHRRQAAKAERGYHNAPGTSLLVPLPGIGFFDIHSHVTRYAA
jgi:hypothetical protein